VPEGDTLHRAAAGLRPALVGNPVTGFDSPSPAVAAAASDLVGRRITGVDAHGKHLLIRFEGDLALRTHLRMTGSWHLYRPGEAWTKPRRRASVTIETERAVAVCFNAPEVEILRGAAAAGGGGLAGRVGLDLLTTGAEPDQVLARWRSRPELPIGVAVMRQYLAAGIGNVYKSEVLFLCRVDPFACVRDLPDEALREVAATAQREMRQNLRGGPRTIRRSLGGGRYWVYGRSGKRCYECGARVGMRRQGDDGRSTYFCPDCQGVGRLAPGA
jgi:endonuclease-8